MEINFILILIIVVLAIVVVKLYEDKHKSKNRFDKINQKAKEEKNLAKEKILEMLNKKEKLENHEVVNILGVSRDSVINYFDELEREGKVKQVGKSGRNVFYSKT